MNVRELPEKLKKKAENELNEKPLEIEQELEELREWLKAQPHLNARQDDQWLLAFLRGCKHNLDRTKQKIDAFYTARTLIPELFANRDPLSPEIQKILKSGVNFPLSSQFLNAKEDQPIIVTRPKSADLKIHVLDLVKVGFMTIDILMCESDSFSIAGLKVITDLAELPLENLLQMTPSNCKKIFTCIQSAYPIRIKQMHLLNTPSFFDPFFRIIRTFMGKKLRSRINLQSGKNTQQLYNFIPREALPKEFGGDEGSLDEMAVEWKVKIESYRDWFLEDAQYCSNESKRLHKDSYAWSMLKKLFWH